MIELRDYQIDGLNALWNYYSTGGKDNVLLCWPTGVGKSICPAIFIKEAMRLWPSQRFMLLTHSSELVKQDAEALLEVWPTAPIGIYSASLKKKEIVNPIIYATIQSVNKIDARAFGKRDIVWVDEAHLISDDDSSMYLKFINSLKEINPALKVIGLTATQFRIGMGMLTDGKLWGTIAHDLTSMENFNKLILDGYLAPLVPKSTAVELDVSSVSVQKGEFIQSQLQHEVDKAEITWKALQETIHYGQNRKSWLIFATGIDHADHISEALNGMGIDCASVHSKQKSEHNDNAIKAFKNYKLRAIANYGKLTTGFNHPGIDLIVMLRPTMSAALWVQMLGRGTRPAVGKSNTLVLDFAKNTLRLGPINAPLIPRKKGDKQGEIPIKICEACGVYNHISARECSSCNHPFEFKVKIVERASSEELIAQYESPIIEYCDVTHVIYKEKQKAGKAPYLTVTYFSGMNAFKEYVFPENMKFKRPFSDWWKQRSPGDVPTTTAEAVLRTGELRQPRRIRVHTNRKLNGRLFPEVLSSEW